MSFINISEDSEFPLGNLPYGIFSTPKFPTPRPGVAIGDYVLDLNAVSDFFTGPLMKDVAKSVFAQETLNDFMSLTREHWTEARQYITKLLSKDEPYLRDNATLRSGALIALSAIDMHMPAKIGDYTDFYASIDHATNIGKMMRGPGNELMPNYKHLPVAYHGRASSVIVSGTPVARPCGQTCQNNDQPEFGPSKLLDFELEMGCFIGGPANVIGKPIRMKEIEDRLFGLVLLNDWSARDIQRWEYQPLGPFLSKNFSTSISPWIVTFEALKPFIVNNPVQDPKPLPYLTHEDDFNFDISLEVLYRPLECNKASVVCKSNFKHLYWTLKQMVAHHTISGCNLNPGDLLGTGTISGSEPRSFGSLMELTWKGTKPLKFESDDGEEITRTFIKDGDEIILKAHCQGIRHKVGFGECSALVIPSKLGQSRPSILISTE